MPPCRRRAAAAAGTISWCAGDTLSHIARRCRSSVMAIARASGVANPDRIEVGQRLIIPHGERMAAAPGTGRGRPRPPRRTPATDSRAATRSIRWRAGRGSAFRALLAANPGIEPHKIEIGDMVRLPAGAALPYAGAAARARAGRRRRRRTEARPRHDPPRDEPAMRDEAGRAGQGARARRDVSGG